MNILRKLALSFLSLVFLLSLSLTALFWSLNNSLGQRAVIKGWLDDSEFYARVVDKAVDELQKEIEKKDWSTSDAPEAIKSIDAEIIERVAGKVLNPSLLQNEVEKILDAVYDWLEGSSPTLDFTIDLTEQKTALAESITYELRTHLSGLPGCTLAELRNFSDPFSATCNPPNLDEKLDELRNGLMSSDDFLPDPTIHSSAIKVGETGDQKTIEESLQDLPKWYQKAKKLAWIATGLSIVFAAGIFFLSKSRRNGIKHLSIYLAISATLLLASGILIAKSTDIVNKYVKFDSSAEEAAGEIYTEFAKPLAVQVTGTLSSWQLRFALIYALIASGGIAYLIATRQRQDPDTATEPEHGHIPDAGEKTKPETGLRSKPPSTPKN